jgi:hypothetical protein
MDPNTQQMALQNLQMQSPELADLVKQYLAQMQQSKPGGMNGSSVDMRVQPEARAPRRATPSV